MEACHAWQARVKSHLDSNIAADQILILLFFLLMFLRCAARSKSTSILFSIFRKVSNLISMLSRHRHWKIVQNKNKPNFYAGSTSAFFQKLSKMANLISTLAQHRLCKNFEKHDKPHFFASSTPIFSTISPHWNFHEKGQCCAPTPDASVGAA